MSFLQINVTNAQSKTESDERRTDSSFYLIQFHSLRLEAEHVDGKVVVLLLQQLHPKKHKIPPISKCFWLDPWRPCFQQMPQVYAAAPQAADWRQEQPLHF